MNSAKEPPIRALGLIVLVFLAPCARLGLSIGTLGLLDTLSSSVLVEGTSRRGAWSNIIKRDAEDDNIGNA